MVSDDDDIVSDDDPVYDLIMAVEAVYDMAVMAAEVRGDDSETVCGGLRAWCDRLWDRYIELIAAGEASGQYL